MVSGPSQHFPTLDTIIGLLWVAGAMPVISRLLFWHWMQPVAYAKTWGHHTQHTTVSDSIRQSIWGVPYMGVPKMDGLLLENPIKMDDLDWFRGAPIYGNPSIRIICILRMSCYLWHMVVLFWCKKHMLKSITIAALRLCSCTAGAMMLTLERCGICRPWSSMDIHGSLWISIPPLP